MADGFSTWPANLAGPGQFALGRHRSRNATCGCSQISNPKSETNSEPKIQILPTALTKTRRSDRILAFISLPEKRRPRRRRWPTDHPTQAARVGNGPGSRPVVAALPASRIPAATGECPRPGGSLRFTLRHTRVLIPLPCFARGGEAAAGEAGQERGVGPPRVAGSVSLHGASPWHPTRRTGTFGQRQRLVGLNEEVVS